MYHGLSAYNRVSSDFATRELLARAATLASVEACWSDKPLGPIGVFVYPQHAEIRQGFTRDVYSTVDENGVRWGNQRAYDYYVDREEGEDSLSYYERVCRGVDHDAPVKSQRYAEFHAVADPDAVWVKKGLSRVWKLRAKVLAKSLGGLPVFEV